jgi:hypothetical protein
MHEVGTGLGVYTLKWSRQNYLNNWRYFKCIIYIAPVTVAERSKECTVFARSETVIVGSNNTQGMDV